MNDSKIFDTLDLETLHVGLPGLTVAWGKLLGEASQVCLEFHNHRTGVELQVTGLSEGLFQVYWKGGFTDQIIRAWNDEQEMTEFGACGIAILLMLKLTPFTVIRRSRKGSGIDYWLGLKNAELPFQDAARLEISGILKENRGNPIKTRVENKLKQSQSSDNTLLPAIIVVVEFSRPFSHVVQK